VVEVDEVVAEMEVVDEVAEVDSAVCGRAGWYP
jgi:hypothetical protein